jgi:hypothetical protein
MPENLEPEEVKAMTQKIKLHVFVQGRFDGHKKSLILTNNQKFPYAIVHQCDLFGQSSESYEKLDDAVYDFVELMKVYG